MGNQADYQFRKITKAEFDRLQGLFPGDEPLWSAYRAMRMEEFDRREIDVYVVEQGQAFIGELSVNYVSHDLPSEAVPGQRAYLQAFRLDREHQGQGLGQKLIQFALSDLERQGYTEFTVGVEEDNARAKHIYFKLGFTEAIDKGCGDAFDPSDYTLYRRNANKGLYYRGVD